MSKEAFLKELKTLLETYNVGIASEINLDSDMHGVYDQKITFYHRNAPYDWEIWLSVDGFTVHSSDL